MLWEIERGGFVFFLEGKGEGGNGLKFSNRVEGK